MKWLCVKSESSCEYKSETGECTISEEVLIEEGGCPYRVFEKIKNEEGVKEMLKHKSDCAVHNEPAYPKGECDCGILTEKEKQNIKLEVLAKCQFGLEVKTEEE